MANKNLILSLKDIVVKFRVRSQILTSIRNVSFDIYEGETVAIVGESGSGKSVLTKTLTNMIESNGYISNGSIMYYPGEDAKCEENTFFKEEINLIKLHKGSLSKEILKDIKNVNKNKIKSAKIKIETLNKELIANPELNVRIEKEVHENEKIIFDAYKEMSSFSKLSRNTTKICKKVMDDLIESNDVSKIQVDQLQSILTYLRNEEYLTEFEQMFESILTKHLNHQKIDTREIKLLIETWKFQTNSQEANKKIAQQQLKKLRGATIATIFQDPMTSLNPLLSVGFQISEAIIQHQGKSSSEAKIEAIKLMQKVGIPNAESRYKDIPGKYSGGMRQRIVIAIAFACRPKILICDEPTTALDVTIQAQILDLIKQLKKEYKLTVIFITHDLGVVANIADRVAVLYAGEVVEYGKVSEIFFDARHPYTWALLSSLPQLGEKGDELFSIEGTPPSLFNQIVGDAFAPRNKYALAIDYEIAPPMFAITKTHHARTWLLDPRAPKIERPKELDRLREAVSRAKVGE